MRRWLYCQPVKVMQLSFDKAATCWYSSSMLMDNFPHPTLSTLGGIAFPPTPMRWQSIKSPSSRKVSRPTTTPFSDATTAQYSLHISN